MAGERDYSEQSQTRVRWGLVLLAVALVVFNFVFISSHGWARLGWSILGYSSLFLIYKLTRFSLNDIGLSPANFKNGLQYGGITILIILAGVLVFFLFDRSAFHDPRYHHSLSTALYSSLVLLPLKTVIFEELAFRGMLLALLFRLKNNQRIATLISSLAFGLWHVGSAGDVSVHGVGSDLLSGTATIIGTVLVTTLAGIFFCELRWRSKSLLAPIAAHWFVNGFATILAALSW